MMTNCAGNSAAELGAKPVLAARAIMIIAEMRTALTLIMILLLMIIRRSSQNTFHGRFEN